MAYMTNREDIFRPLFEGGILRELQKIPAFSAVDEDTVRDILEACAVFSEEVLGPLYATGERQGCRHDPQTHRVLSPDGWQEAYGLLAQGGWNGAASPCEYGGMGLPLVLGVVITEMISTANLSLGLCPILTQSVIRGILQWGTPAQKAFYLPPLIEGRWTGTMNLTEPQAGSDVGRIQTMAFPQEDGTYRIKGTKIFISYGEHSLSENIIHIVLARLPSSAAGTRGLSMFIVPKYLPDESGKPTIPNDLSALSLERKMGLHGSPTCVMEYGNKEGAVGYLIGTLDQGMKAMFTLMNDARVNIGVQGLSLMERAYQQAVDFAKTRQQGRIPGMSADQQVPIIQHPDVQRMLLTIKAHITASRSLLYHTALLMDKAAHLPEGEEKDRLELTISMLTPVAKAWPTERGVEMTSMALQVFGGMGYIEETGVAQFYRDSRVTTIYEGTTGIQAIDLVLRKIPLKDGDIFRPFVDQMGELAEKCMADMENDDLLTIGEYLDLAKDDFLQAAEWMLQKAGFLGQPEEALAGATPFLHLMGLCLGGLHLAQQAWAASEKLPQAEGELREDLLEHIHMARFYAENFLPHAKALSISCTRGVQTLRALRV